MADSTNDDVWYISCDDLMSHLRNGRMSLKQEYHILANRAQIEKAYADSLKEWVATTERKIKDQELEFGELRKVLSLLATEGAVEAKYHDKLHDGLMDEAGPVHQLHKYKSKHHRKGKAVKLPQTKHTSLEIEEIREEYQAILARQREKEEQIQCAKQKFFERRGKYLATKGEYERWRKNKWKADAKFEAKLKTLTGQCLMLGGKADMARSLYDTFLKKEESTRDTFIEDLYRANERIAKMEENRVSVVKENLVKYAELLTLSMEDMYEAKEAWVHKFNGTLAALTPEEAMADWQAHNYRIWGFPAFQEYSSDAAMCALLGTAQSPAKHVIDGLLETPTIATADLDHTDERAAKDDNRCMKDLLGNLLVQQVTDTTDVEAVTCDNIGFRKNLLDKPKKEGETTENVRVSQLLRPSLEGGRSPELPLGLLEEVKQDDFPEQSLFTKPRTRDLGRKDISGMARPLISFTEKEADEVDSLTSFMDKQRGHSARSHAERRRLAEKDDIRGTSLDEERAVADTVTDERPKPTSSAWGEADELEGLLETRSELDEGGPLEEEDGRQSRLGRYQNSDDQMTSGSPQSPKDGAKRLSARTALFCVESVLPPTPGGADNSRLDNEESCEEKALITRSKGSKKRPKKGSKETR